MKILHISPSYYPAFQYGGPIKLDYLLNKFLVKKGISVDVFTTNAGLENDMEILLDQWTNVSGTNVKYFSYCLRDNYNFSHSMLLNLIKEISKYNLVHISYVWNFPVLAGALVSKINKIPYMISPHGTLCREAIELKSKHLKKLYFTLLGRVYIDWANGIHFTSEDEMRNSTSYLNIKSKPYIVPNGIDLSEYENLPGKNQFKVKYPILSGKRYILFLGRVNKKKGLDILVNAFKLLAKGFEDLFLVVVGPDNDGYKAELENMIDKKGLKNKVLFTGMLLGDDKLAAYTGAEVFVLPSYSENFGMTVVEAMACNVPILISDKVGIYDDVEKYNAGIVTSTTTDSLYSGLKKLLENPDISKSNVVNAGKLVKDKYDISKVADKMICVYEDIIRSTKSKFEKF